MEKKKEFLKKVSKKDFYNLFYNLYIFKLFNDYDNEEKFFYMLDSVMFYDYEKVKSYIDFKYFGYLVNFENFKRLSKENIFLLLFELNDLCKDRDILKLLEKIIYFDSKFINKKLKFVKSDYNSFLIDKEKFKRVIK